MIVIEFKKWFRDRYYEIDKGILIKDDCFNVLKNIPDKSINLIILDPPYNIGKDKWDKFKSVDDYVDFILQTMHECQRVLKDNGSLYLFHNDFEQLTELQYNIKRKTEFKYKQLLIWDKYNGTPQKHAYKGALWKQVNSGGKRKYSNCKEYAVFYTLQDEQFEYIKDIYELQDFIKYMNDTKNKLHINLKELNKEFGYVAGASWWFSVKQPRFINEEDYIKLQSIYTEFNIPYEELQQWIIKRKEEFECKRYTYNQPENNLSILQFPIPDKEERVKHKTQKSEALIEHLIATSSNEGDIILSLFSGSGTDSVVAEKKNRYWIAVEREQEYCEINVNRIEKLHNTYLN